MSTTEKVRAAQKEYALAMNRAYENYERAVIRAQAKWGRVINQAYGKPAKPGTRRKVQRD